MVSNKDITGEPFGVIIDQKLKKNPEFMQV